MIPDLMESMTSPMHIGVVQRDLGIVWNTVRRRDIYMFDKIITERGTCHDSDWAAKAIFFLSDIQFIYFLLYFREKICLFIYFRKSNDTLGHHENIPNLTHL